MNLSNTYGQLEDYLAKLQASGRYWFTLSEAEKELNTSPKSIHKQLVPLARKKKVVMIRKEFYAIIAPELRINGAPSVTYYIDGLMKTLNRSYYISLLNAAAWYGAAHQQPQKYSIVVHRPYLPPIKKDYARVDFIYKSQWDNKDIVQQKTNAGYVNTSSSELTALDLCYYSKRAGGINHVTTVLQELAEGINPQTLEEVAGRFSSLMAVQRLGYLLEFLGHPEKVHPLKEWLNNQKHHAALLDPGAHDSSSKVTGNDWKIIVNTEIDPDL